MTDLIPVPVYDEKLIRTWLLDQAAVTDLVGSEGIYTILPKAVSFPVVLLARVGGAPASRAMWSDQALIQFDVWADQRATARLIADTLRQQLASGLAGTHELGVVTDVTLGGMRWLPDVSYTPAKPRFSFDAQVTLHPPVT